MEEGSFDYDMHVNQLQELLKGDFYGVVKYLNEVVLIYGSVANSLLVYTLDNCCNENITILSEAFPQHQFISKLCYEQKYFELCVKFMEIRNDLSKNQKQNSKNDEQRVMEIPDFYGKIQNGNILEIEHLLNSGESPNTVILKNNLIQISQQLRKDNIEKLLIDRLEYYAPSCSNIKSYPNPCWDNFIQKLNSSEYDNRNKITYITNELKNANLDGIEKIMQIHDESIIEFICYHFPNSFPALFHEAILQKRFELAYRTMESLSLMLVSNKHILHDKFTNQLLKESFPYTAEDIKMIANVLPELLEDLKKFPNSSCFELLQAVEDFDPTVNDLRRFDIIKLQDKVIGNMTIGNLIGRIGSNEAISSLMQRDRNEEEFLELIKGSLSLKRIESIKHIISFLSPNSKPTKILHKLLSKHCIDGAAELLKRCRKTQLLMNIQAFNINLTMMKMDVPKAPYQGLWEVVDLLPPKHPFTNILYYNIHLFHEELSLEHIQKIHNADQSLIASPGFFDFLCMESRTDLAYFLMTNQKVDIGKNKKLEAVVGCLKSKWSIETKEVLAKYLNDETLPNSISNDFFIRSIEYCNLEAFKMLISNKRIEEIFLKSITKLLSITIEESKFELLPELIKFANAETIQSFASCSLEIFEKMYNEITKTCKLDEKIMGYAGMCAIKAHNHPVLKFLLKEGFNPNIRYGQFEQKKKSKSPTIPLIQELEGEFPLTFAARLGTVESVKILLENGADVANRNKLGFTLLRTALWASNQDVTAYLCNVEGIIQGELNEMLNLACTKGYMAIAKFLISQGANLESSSNFVYLAIRNKHFEIAKMLIEKGALIDEKCIEEACQLSSAKMIDILLEHGAKITKIPVSVKSIDVVKSFLNHGVSIELFKDYCISIYETSLRNQTNKDHSVIPNDVVVFLLTKGMNPNSMLSKQKTLDLLLFCSSTPELLLKAFVESGANINQKDPNDISKLCIACPRGSLYTVQLLVKHGADVNVIDDDNRRKKMIAVLGQPNDSSFRQITPLSEACRGNNTRVVRFLLSVGAEIEPTGAPSKAIYCASQGDSWALIAPHIIGKTNGSPKMLADAIVYLITRNLFEDAIKLTGILVRTGYNSYHSNIVFDAIQNIRFENDQFAIVREICLQGFCFDTCKIQQGNTDVISLLLENGATFDPHSDQTDFASNVRIANFMCNISNVEMNCNSFVFHMSRVPFRERITGYYIPKNIFGRGRSTTSTSSRTRSLYDD